MRKFPLVIAHRGASGYAPENTILAFQKALKMGADMIEIDIRQNAQGDLVVAHDKKQSGAVDVLLLTMALKFINGQAKIYLDLKEKGLVQKVIDEVAKSQLSQIIAVGSLKLSVIKELEKAPKSYNIAFAFKSLFLNKKKIIKVLNNYRINILSLPWYWSWAIGPSFLAELHKNNCQGWVWTINSQWLIKKYAQMGVDGIVTNYPDRVIKAIKSLQNS